MPRSGSRFTSAHGALLVFVLWALAESTNLSHREAEIAATLGFAALVASIVGFAFVALAGSAFAYLRLDPVQAVHTLVVCSIAIQLYAVLNIRRVIRWKPLLPMIGAGAATVPLGARVLLQVDSSAYAIGLGIFLSAYGSYVLFRREHRARPASTCVDVVVGALGGLTGGLAGLPGPSVAIWCSLRGLDKLQQRATYQPFILVMQVVALLALHWQDTASTLTLDDLRFVPFALIGGVAGFALFQRMSNRQFHAVMSTLLVMSGIGLLTRVL
jgi:uncharacterized membrane protein YfcA